MIDDCKILKKCFFVDMEGVLIPEMWPYISKKYAIKELEITTREYNCYEELVKKRIDILNDNNITVFDLNDVVVDLGLLPGAKCFIDKLNEKYQVVLVSDAFKPLVNHFWVMLGKPDLKCHEFLFDDNGSITDALYSRKGGKQSLLKKYEEDGYEVFAVGDAFNDLEMLKMAKKGFLYKPSKETAAFSEDLLIVNSFEEILDEVNIN